MSYSRLLCHCIGFTIIISLTNQYAVQGKEAQETVELVRKAVGQKVERIKTRLLDQYNAYDKGLILKNKENLDSFFIPLFLLHELDDQEHLDFCRLFRFSYEDRRYRIEKQLVAEKGNWLSAAFKPFNLGEDRYVKFHLTMRRYSTIGAHYPIVFFVKGYLSREGGVAYGVSYEPYFANRDLAFPVHPEWARFRWTTKVKQAENDKVSEDSAFEHSLPLFNNPPGIYAPADCMKLVPFLMGADQFAGCCAAQTQPERGNRGALLTLYQDDGIPVRRTEIQLDGVLLKLIRIQQNPVKVLHFSPENYQIRRTLNNRVVGVEDFQPSSILDYLPDGRTIDVSFESVRDSDGRLVGLPKEIIIYRKGKTVFSARFTEIRYQRGDASSHGELQSSPEMKEVWQKCHQVYTAINQRDVDWKPNYYSQDDLSTEVENNLLRARLKFNIYAAIKMQNFLMVVDVLDRYRKLLRRDGIGYDMYLFSVEALTQMAFEFIGDGAGSVMVDSFLRDAYAHCDRDELIQQLVRLIRQYRLGFALLAIDVLANKIDSDNDGSLHSWLVNLEKRIRPIAAGRDDKYRKPDYVYLTEYERVNYRIERFLPDPIIIH